jgi:hypothetical protein
MEAENVGMVGNERRADMPLRLNGFGHVPQ